MCLRFICPSHHIGTARSHILLEMNISTRMGPACLPFLNDLSSLFTMNRLACIYAACSNASSKSAPAENLDAMQCIHPSIHMYALHLATMAILPGNESVCVGGGGGGQRELLLHAASWPMACDANAWLRMIDSHTVYIFSTVAYCCSWPGYPCLPLANYWWTDWS